MISGNTGYVGVSPIRTKTLDFSSALNEAVVQNFEAALARHGLRKAQIAIEGELGLESIRSLFVDPQFQVSIHEEEGETLWFPSESDREG